MENFGKKFLKWTEILESQRLKVDLKKTKIMVGGLKLEVLQTKGDLCAKSCKIRLANSVLCPICGK